MEKARARELARNFPQNGMRMLLERPANVRDLLQIVSPQFVSLIDFSGMKAERGDFIARDFRHVEADLVLRAPARLSREARRQHVMIYILIEHQSQPDTLMPLRLLDYVTQVYKSQMRDWSSEHDTFTNLRLHPVLPVVLYTGERPWPTVGTLSDLMHLGDEFAAVTPVLRPFFLNLPTAADKLLHRQGGAFGAVLRLYRERSTDAATFRERLTEVIREIKSLPKIERIRWREILSYFDMLVYHSREKPEQRGLHEIVESYVDNDADRREYMAARQTIAESMKEEAAIAHGKETLLRQLHIRFRNVPAEITARVESADNLRQLNRWLDRFATANSIEEVGILPTRTSRG
jgi:hypothetical protein